MYRVEVIYLNIDRQARDGRAVLMGMGWLGAGYPPARGGYAVSARLSADGRYVALCILRYT